MRVEVTSFGQRAVRGVAGDPGNSRWRRRAGASGGDRREKGRGCGCFEGVELSGDDSSLGDRSPEKAGGGGSIPSLATTFSITYEQLPPQIASTGVQTESKLGFPSNSCSRLLAPLAPVTW
jgi:hypothetical protein